MSEIVSRRARYEFWNTPWSRRVALAVSAGILREDDPRRYPEEEARHEAWLERICLRSDGERRITQAYSVKQPSPSRLRVV